MSASTGENEMGLRKILDFTRLASIVILLLHFYFYCYAAFAYWELTADIGDRFLTNISQTGLFKKPVYSKLIALALLIVSLLGAKGKKSEKISKQAIILYLVVGLLFYFPSFYLLQIQSEVQVVAGIYMAATGFGFLFILSGGTLLSRYIQLHFHKDIFNELNETFPQEERLLENEFSINLPARYKLKGKTRKSWINVVNPFRSLLVCGSPGAGKSWYIIQHVIKQHIQKGFTMLVYDFKYDDLSRIVYNVLLKNQQSYKVKPSFCLINFDDLSRSHRCNPLDAATMYDITDATEASRTIMLGLNKQWIAKQGDFFVESPINFLTAVIWYLKKYQNGKFCTLPHAIELMQEDYKELFPVLKSEPEIEVLINPFISAYQNDAMEQLEGQVASAKIGMARLSSPQLYWVLSANDFTLDINNPDDPKILCLANNPQKIQIYGAVLSLYITRLIKLVNKKNQQKCSLIFDEFPTVYFNDIDSLIATARSNRVATCLGLQDFSQLKKDYGADQAAVIMNIVGNIISGQVTGETAKNLSERFGKIMQVKESVSISRTDTSISKSGQLDYAIPPSKIAALSSGEFVGMVADDPHEKIKLKTFHCEIINDVENLKAEEAGYKKIPVFQQVSQQEVMDNYFQVKQDVKGIIETEVARLKRARGEIVSQKKA